MKMSIYARSSWGMMFLLASANAFADALPDEPPAPKNNPTTPAKVELGKKLYFDPRLSITGTVSCNSCHNVMSNGTDSRPTSMGVHGKTGARNAPTVWNAAFLSAQFWDGRAATLEDQAKGPILNPVEMGMPTQQAPLSRIRDIPGYQLEFKAVFGGDEPITYDNIAAAIAAYERTLITRNSPYDRYIKGDKKALSAQAQRGLELVKSLGCTGCHSGPLFAGPVTLKVGEGFYQRFPIYSDNDYVAKYRLMEDTGRFTVTRSDADKYMWRVPTWRNVALTAPYFHNGAVPTLDEAVRVMAKAQLDKDLSDEQTKNIVAFLNSLTGEFPAQAMPRLPETPNTSLWLE